MALTVAQRKAAWRRFIEQALNGGSATWTKADLDDAVVAINQWLDDNQASLVSALNSGAPNFGGANSTATQKTLLFVYTVLVRQGLL